MEFLLMLPGAVVVRVAAMATVMKTASQHAAAVRAVEPAWSSNARPAEQTSIVVVNAATSAMNAKSCPRNSASHISPSGSKRESQADLDRRYAVAPQRSQRAACVGHHQTPARVDHTAPQACVEPQAQPRSSPRASAA